jgi:hypothetical protein
MTAHFENLEAVGQDAGGNLAAGVIRGGFERIAGRACPVAVFRDPRTRVTDFWVDASDTLRVGLRFARR